MFAVLCWLELIDSDNIFLFSRKFHLIFMTKLGIDASRFKSDGATGVEWYSWHIIRAIEKALGKDKKTHLILYSRDRISDFQHVENRVLEEKRFWTLRALSREIRKNPPDILFVPSHTLPLKLPKRSVITIHDVAFRYLRKSYSFFQYHHLNLTTKHAVKHADKIIVPSETTKSDLINLFNCPAEKISCVYHGFTPPKNPPNDIFEKSEILKYFEITPSLPYILFVGRLESKKNLARLVEAFASFNKKHPEYKLVLAGKRGVGFQEVLNAVNKSGVAENIIMPGYITEDEKSFLYQHCKFFAFCSLYEGFGLPILEAFHYGKPVLTSSVSSMAEVGADAVLYADPYDVENISEGLETLAQEDNYNQELVKKGRARLEDFSWEKAAEETLKVLYGQ